MPMLIHAHPKREKQIYTRDSNGLFRVTEHTMVTLWFSILTKWFFKQFSSVQLCLTLCDPMDCSSQASLSITNSWSLLKLMSIELVRPFNHLTLCCPLLLLPSFFPSIRVFSKESVLWIRWPKYWSAVPLPSPSLLTDAQIVPDLTSGNPFRLAFRFFWHNPIIL